MKPLAKHITESFQNVNESELDFKIDDIVMIHFNGGSAISKIYKVNKNTVKVKGSRGLYDLKKSHVAKILTRTEADELVDKPGYVDHITESSENVDMIAMAIEYLIGQPIARYHDEANNYAYQLAKKNSTGWITISRKEVDDTVKMHGLSLNKMNESSNSIDKQIAYQESRINSAQKLHDEAKGTVAKKKSMRDLLDEQSKLAELKAYAKIYKDRT